MIFNATRMVSNINTCLGALLIFSFGLFILVMGFNLKGMINPIAEALALEDAGQY